MANRRDTRDDVLLSWSVPALLQEPRHTTLTYAALAFWASFFSNFFFASSCFNAAPCKRCLFRRPFPRFVPTPFIGFSYIFLLRAASSSARCFSFFLSRFFRAVKDCFSNAP